MTTYVRPAEHYAQLQARGLIYYSQARGAWVETRKAAQARREH